MIRIFVGCAPNNDDLESLMVLEYTIAKYASEPFEITWMRLSHDGPFSGWDTSTWATPFSGFRYAVPYLCGYEGRAIYMDSDVIIRGDIAELWHTDMDDAEIIAHSAARLCVSLWDCSAAPRFSLDHLRAGARPASTNILPFADGSNWNCLDGQGYESVLDPAIKALHYSSMPHQPHMRAAMERMRKAGVKHWYDGPVVRHWRSDVFALFWTEFNDALNEGYALNQYKNHAPFGPVNKRSNAGLSAEIPRWGRP